MPMASEDVEEGNHESRLRFLLSAQIADAVFSRSRSECWPKRGGLQDSAVVQCTSNRKCVATRRKYGETYHLSYITLPAFKIPQKTKTFFATGNGNQLNVKHLQFVRWNAASEEFLKIDRAPLRVMPRWNRDGGITRRQPSSTMSSLWCQQQTNVVPLGYAPPCLLVLSVAK